MCDSLVAVGGETADGVTLFAKNSDRKRDECQPFLQFVEAHHAPASLARCTHIEIPQVARTNRVMGHSPWWVWGFEHGVNEHGVAIGNHTVFSREPVEEEPGLIGMDLVRLGLERSATAREALDTITRLLEAHGQGGAALAPDGAGYHNSFTLADPSEAWLLETSRRHWAARRTLRDALTNHYCLGNDWEFGSGDLESHARDQSFWHSDERLDLARAFRNPHVPGRISEPRLGRSQELLAESSGRIEAATLQGILRDHGEGGRVRLPGSTPDEDRYFTLCMHSEPVGTTTASLVAPLPTDRSKPWPVWISFATPCTGSFLPIYLDGVIPWEMACSARDEGSAWWVFRGLADAAAGDFPRHTPRVREAWSKLEERIETERVQVEAAAQAVDVDAASSILSNFMARSSSAALELAGSLRTSL